MRPSLRGLGCTRGLVRIHVSRYLARLGNTARRDEGPTHHLTHMHVVATQLSSGVEQRRGRRQARGTGSCRTGRVGGRPRWGPARPVDQPSEGMAPSASLSRVQTFMLMTTGRSRAAASQWLRRQCHRADFVIEGGMVKTVQPARTQDHSPARGSAQYEVSETINSCGRGARVSSTSGHGEPANHEVSSQAPPVPLVLSLTRWALTRRGRRSGLGDGIPRWVRGQRDPAAGLP
jgi:hypothetical protein